MVKTFKFIEKTWELIQQSETAENVTWDDSDIDENSDEAIENYHRRMSAFYAMFGVMDSDNDTSEFEGFPQF